MADDCTGGHVGMVCQQHSDLVNHYGFAWGAGDAGWQSATDSNGVESFFILDPAIWNHIVIVANHRAKPRVVSVYQQGVLLFEGWVHNHDYQISTPVFPSLPYC